MFPRPNTVTNGKYFYVSYNNVDWDIYGSDTTALVVGQMEKFYILNGDHVKAYKDIMDQGFEKCLDYYRSQKDLINDKSDPL